MDIAFNYGIMHQPVDIVGRFPLTGVDDVPVEQEATLIDKTDHAGAAALPEVLVGGACI